MENYGNFIWSSKIQSNRMINEKLGKLIFFWKEDFKTNPWNQKSLNLDQDSQRNHQVNKREISEIENREKPKLKLKLT